MPSSVELALSSLLPTTSPLPAELIELSNSLLSQSRTRAASLKPEEEIGRTYACCHVACERLGKKFALEIGRPQPPVKPKVYEKLKTYLGSVLRTPTTPKGRRVEDKVPEVRTATPKKTIATATPPSRRTLRTAIVSGEKPASQDPSSTRDVPVSEGAAVDDVEHDEYADEQDDELTPVKRPSKTPLRRKEKHARRDGVEEDLGAAGLLPGLGTMFQPSIDWLSDERRADYASWKENVMREATLIDQRG